ncbi:glycosyltransferase family 2 protein [Dactylosporangium sp. NPDC051541]|uniref:glycosyltransferase family 2 protein n=1 Tax=Dactylosporangium sp. NPDC051541 TaxID=3363977 RepID=UPI0037A07361
MTVFTSENRYRVTFEAVPRPRWWRPLFVVYLAAAVLFVVWRCQVVNWHTWLGPIAVVFDIFGALIFGMLLWHVRYPSVPRHHAVDVSDYVVDCLIPTHTESADLVEPTVLGALRIRGVRRVLVLGNRYREDMRDMAVRLGAEYHARDDMAFGKAGNLNAGLAHTDADYVITLDADHIAVPELLERMIGYFDDPDVALVQSPQAYYNTDTLTFRRTRNGVWAEAQMFYRCVQPSKNHWNAAFYVGTSAVLRRQALDSTGGFATGTVTEDIHTAMRLHAAGWRSVFLPEPLAFGLEAANLREFFAQRRRWAVGSLQLLLRHRDSPLRRKGLSVAQRVHYLHATAIHLGGPQRLFHLVLPTVTLLTMTSPVNIPFGLYSSAFLGYLVLSWTMMKVYFGRAYHPVHSEAYSLVAAVSQTAALLGLFRRERRYKAADKQGNFRERTWVRGLLWTMTLICGSTLAYGGWLIAHGRLTGLIISATIWAGLHAFWIGSLLAYLVRYERRPAPQYAALTGPARYEWVMDRSAALIADERAAVPPATPEPRLEARSADPAPTVRPAMRA